LINNQFPLKNIILGKIRLGLRLRGSEETLIEILEGLEMEFYLDDKEVKNSLKHFTIEYIGY